MAKLREGGSKAISLKKRGRRTGEKRTLTAEQEAQLQRFLIDKMPDQLKLPFALWTREAVKLLIKHRYGIKMPIRTVGEYLKRWGFTPQKPIKRAYEQSSQAVQQWLKTDYPLIAKQAKKEKAEIYWGDETGFKTASILLVVLRLRRAAGCQTGCQEKPGQHDLCHHERG